MRCATRAIAAFLLLLSLSGAAHAEEGARITAGLKTWTNSWTRNVPGSASMYASSIPLVGWGAEVLFSNHIFMEASYLMSFQDYIFNQAGGDIQKERYDLDVALGYQFHRTMGFYAGFRSTQIMDRGTHFKETVAGPLFGVRGALPVINNVSLFGRLTYLPLIERTTFTPTTSKERAFGWFAAGGIKYDVTKRLAGYLGYQYEVSEGEKTDTRDTWEGPTLDVMYVF